MTASTALRVKAMIASLRARGVRGLITEASTARRAHEARRTRRHRRAAHRQRLIHTFVTDLRGPAGPLAFAGAPVRAVIAIPNTTGNVTVTFGALPYPGTLRITVGPIPAGCPTWLCRQRPCAAISAVRPADRRSKRPESQPLISARTNPYGSSELARHRCAGRDHASLHGLELGTKGPASARCREPSVQVRRSMRWLVSCRAR